MSPVSIVFLSKSVNQMKKQHTDEKARIKAAAAKEKARIQKVSTRFMFSNLPVFNMPLNMKNFATAECVQAKAEEEARVNAIAEYEVYIHICIYVCMWV